MPTITTVDASWVNTVANDDAELRRFDTAMFLGDGSSNGVRGGIVRHGDTSLAVSVNGSDQVTVQPGAWVIPAATGLGVYRGALSAATAATAITARNATNPRIDLVVVQAPGIVKTIDGTPGASPSAPALPAQHIELARITVPAVGGGAVTVDSTWRAYATSLGGDLYVETSARLPGSGNQKGQRAVAIDTGTEHVWNGTAWIPSAWQSYTPGLLNATLGTGGTIAGRYVQINKTVHFRAKLVFGTGLSVSSPVSIGLPVLMNTATSLLGTANAVFTDSGTAGYFAGVDYISTSLVRVFVLGANGLATSTSPTVPFTWVAGDVIEVSGTYEAA